MKHQRNRKHVVGFLSICLFGSGMNQFFRNLRSFRQFLETTTALESATTTLDEIYTTTQSAVSNEDSSKSSLTIPPTRTTKQNARFLGSRISSRSPGLDLYENVCIELPPKGGDVILKAYTADASDLPITFPRQDAYIQKARGFPLDQWEVDMERAGEYLFRNETLWTFQLYNNPGHCINDMALNLALDYRNRVNNNSIYRDANPDHDRLFYPNFLASNWGRFLQQGIPPDNWCYRLLQSAGMIHPDTFVDIQSKPGVACFRKLLIPTLTLFRYPQTTSSNSVNSTLLSYPDEALHLLREKLTESLHLSNRPWQSSESTSPSTKDRDKRILLHIRANDQRRKILNAIDLKEHLEANYKVNITVMKEEWKTLAFEDQAKFYNSWEYIITGHGAHQANSIFLRPGSKVMEFFCSRQLDHVVPDPKLTKAGPKITRKQWYGESWFPWFTSWTRKLQIEHFTGPQHCPNMTARVKIADGGDFNLDLDRQIPLVVNRFGLLPRDI